MVASNGVYTVSFCMQREIACGYESLPSPHEFACRRPLRVHCWLYSNRIRDWWKDFDHLLCNRWNRESYNSERSMDDWTQRAAWKGLKAWTTMEGVKHSVQHGTATQSLNWQSSFLRKRLITRKLCCLLPLQPGALLPACDATSLKSAKDEIELFQTSLNVALSLNN